MKINLDSIGVAADEVSPKLMILIPAYNEAPNLDGLIRRLETVDLPIRADVLLVNDGSTDGTGDYLRKNGINHITNLYNLGYGSCLQIGYKYAVRRRYSYVIQMDADGQHDVSNLPRICRALTDTGPDGEKPDIVLGSRFMPESAPYRAGALKQAAFVWLRFLLRHITGCEEYLYDPTTGLQGLSRAAFLYYSLYGNFDTLYPDVNMLAQMILLGFRIRQVPAEMHARTAGKSMHTGLFRHGVYMIHMTLSVMAVGLRLRLDERDRQIARQIRTHAEESGDGGDEKQ